jgi:hypothetical protein
MVLAVTTADPRPGCPRSLAEQRRKRPPWTRSSFSSHQPRPRISPARDENPNLPCWLCCVSFKRRP